MNVIFQRERVHELWGEIFPLLIEHHEELGKYKDFFLDPDISRYCAMEDEGVLRCYTARLEKDDVLQAEIVGYAAFLIQNHLHHVTSKRALQDVLFLAKGYRKGRTGLDLIKFCESQLKAEGVQVIYQYAKPGTTFQSLLETMGYALEEYVYSRRLH